MLRHLGVFFRLPRRLRTAQLEKTQLAAVSFPLGSKMLRTALPRRAVYPALRVGAHRYPYPQVRLASTTSSPRPFLHRTRLLLRWTGYAAASAVLGVTLITGAIFVHDAFTYSEAHVDKVPVSPLALCPETGGPKNLPIVSAFLSDIEDSENERISQKPRLVIVGGGWGVGGAYIDVYQDVEENLYFLQAVGLLSKLSLGDYHVTLISPDTFTTFTPLLPCTCSSWHFPLAATDGSDSCCRGHRPGAVTDRASA